MKCFWCGNDAIFQFKSGKFCCSTNVSKCPMIIKKSQGKRSKTIKDRGFPNKYKGIKYDQIYGKEKSLLIRNKISIGNLGNSGKGSTPEIEENRKRKIKEKTLISNNGGYRIGSGIGKKGWYHGFWCDSSWELAFVIYNLEHHIKFKRNHEKFNYLFENKSYYFLPDFIYEDTNEFVEIKGYFTKQTDEKIKQFPKKLIVLNKEKLDYILNYVTLKYGKNFIKLYEKSEG